MKHHPRSDDNGVDKKKSRRVFTIEEDQALFKLVQRYGDNDWGKVSLKMNDRSPRQCKERWSTYLNPYLNKNPWTDEEEQLLKMKVNEYGQKWSKISKFFTGRPDNCIKNHWNAMMRKEKRMNDLIAQTSHQTANYQINDDIKSKEPNVPPISWKNNSQKIVTFQQLPNFEIVTMNNHLSLPVANNTVNSRQDEINLLDINSLLNF